MSSGETTQQPEPGWYPDPAGRHEHRWWDGLGWTEDVSSHGRQAVDPLTPAKQVQATTAPEKIQRQINKAAPREAAPIPPEVAGTGAVGTPPPPTAAAPEDVIAPDLAGTPPPSSGPAPVPNNLGTPNPAPIQDGVAPAQASGGLFDQKVLVVNQKTKLIEVNTEFALFDSTGAQIGAVRQVGQSKLKKVVRFLGNWDQFFTHTYQVVDATGVVRLGITRPAKFVKSRVVVTDELGDQVGEIIQQNWFGKIRFTYMVNGEAIGGIFAENWRAWNFSIKDAHDREIARITKTFEGVLKTVFTTANNYVLHVHEDLPDPLRQMVFASAVSVDTALKQDERGLGAGSILDIAGG